VVWSLTEVHDDGGRSLRSVMLVVAHWGPWWWWSVHGSVNTHSSIWPS